MNIPKLSTLTIPITHILLMLTAGAIATICAAFAICTHLFIVTYISLICYAVYKNNRSWNFIVISMLLCSLLIMLRINHIMHSYKSDQSFLKKNVAIVGTIKEINYATLYKNQTSITLQTNAIIKKHNALKKAKKIILFFPTSAIKELKENDLIAIESIQLDQPQENSDYQRYLLKENIWATGRGSLHTKYNITPNPLTTIQKIQSSIYQRLHKVSLSLFDPLFLGKKEKNKESLELQHQSVYWGIAHHMARSGAHLAILFGLIMLLLHYTHFAYIYRYLLCVFLLVGYAAISQLSISFTRSLIMILLHIFAKACNRIPSSLHTITITTFIILFYNPVQLFFLDFQLSFGITYIIIWLFNIKNSKTIAFYKRRLVRF